MEKKVCESKDVKADVEQCVRAWKAVLAKFNADRPLRIAEIQTIEQKVALEGKEFVLLAFLGAKYEPGNDQFKPNRVLSLRRVFHPEKFERFINLGAQARNQGAA